ncbi:hypothetical protein FJZ31_03055 [Candidatus Poribacteria bacterium]|nr:hypothetical protein [Candidatus Poribacteria bacterium]
METISRRSRTQAKRTEIAGVSAEEQAVFNVWGKVGVLGKVGRSIVRRIGRSPRFYRSRTRQSLGSFPRILANSATNLESWATGENKE